MSTEAVENKQLNPFFEVTVGNIGCVVKTDNVQEALTTYVGYATLSEAGCGRAGNEEVTLWIDGEPVVSYDPQIGPAINVTMNFTVRPYSQDETVLRLDQQCAELAAEAVRQAIGAIPEARKAWLRSIAEIAAVRYDGMVGNLQLNLGFTDQLERDVRFDATSDAVQRSFAYKADMINGPAYVCPRLSDPELQQILRKYDTMPKSEDDESDQPDSDNSEA